VATSKVSLKQTYPYIVGANIGTTITALLAAIFNAPAALSIAIVHLLFNVIGGIVFLLVPGLKHIPIMLSEILGMGCYRRWYISIVYIILIFFLLPFAFIYFTN
jgi:sodium-dependent phosphate cotransporter